MFCTFVEPLTQCRGAQKRVCRFRPRRFGTLSFMPRLTQDGKKGCVWINKTRRIIFVVYHVKSERLYTLCMYHLYRKPCVHLCSGNYRDSMNVTQRFQLRCIVGFTTWQRCCQLVIHCDLDVVDCCSWEGNGILMLMWLLRDSCLASFFWKLLVSIRMVVARISNMWINCYFAWMRNTPCKYLLNGHHIRWVIGSDTENGSHSVEICPWRRSIRMLLSLKVSWNMKILEYFSWIGFCLRNDILEAPWTLLCWTVDLHDDSSDLAHGINFHDNAVFSVLSVCTYLCQNMPEWFGKFLLFLHVCYSRTLPTFFDWCIERTRVYLSPWNMYVKNQRQRQVTLWRRPFNAIRSTASENIVICKEIV